MVWCLEKRSIQRYEVGSGLEGTAMVSAREKTLIEKNDG